MNKYQRIVLIVAANNLLLIVLCPPYDYLSPARSNVPTFEGFHFIWSETPGRVVNTSFLQLELFVVLANAAIGWLLLKERVRREGTRVDWQRVVLIGMGLNLLVVLFPDGKTTTTSRARYCRRSTASISCSASTRSARW